MRFLSMVRVAETGQKPSERLMNEMGKLIEEAKELTRRFLDVHGDEWNVECEVRQLDGEEFGGGATLTRSETGLRFA